MAGESCPSPLSSWKPSDSPAWSRHTEESQSLKWRERASTLESFVKFSLCGCEAQVIELRRWGQGTPTVFNRELPSGRAVWLAREQMRSACFLEAALHHPSALIRFLSRARAC